MDRLNQVGIAREGLQRRCLIGPEELGHLALLCLEIGELEPRQRIFEIPPDPFNWIQLRAVGGQEH